MKCHWCGTGLITEQEQRARLCEECSALARDEVCPECGSSKRWQAWMCEECTANEMHDLESELKKRGILVSWHITNAGAVCYAETCTRCGKLVTDRTVCTTCSHNVQAYRREYGVCECG